MSGRWEAREVAPNLWLVGLREDHDTVIATCQAEGSAWLVAKLLNDHETRVIGAPTSMSQLGAVHERTKASLAEAEASLDRIIAILDRR